MTSLTFSDYAARLRVFIGRHLPGAASEDVSAADSEQTFARLALSLFELQFASNSPYRRFCSARGVLSGTVADWREIPAISTSAYKEWELTSLALSERTTVFHSSGTTEHRPSRHFHNEESLAIYEASLLPWFGAHFLADADPSPQPSPLRKARGRIGASARMKMIFLTPPPAVAPHSSLVHMFETVRRKFGASDSVFTGRVDAGGAWVLDREHVLSALAMAAERGDAVALLGTAFNLVQLFDYLAESKLHFQLPTGSRVLETGGYKGRSRVLSKSELHTLIAQFLGIAEEFIISEYGMSELSSQAYDGIVQSPKSKVQSPRAKVQSAEHEIENAKGVFRFPPWARAQVISPETGREVKEGETGLIRVFDLANVRSVLAIQTEDLAIRRRAGFELLGRARMAEARGCSLMSA